MSLIVAKSDLRSRVLRFANKKYLIIALLSVGCFLTVCYDSATLIARDGRGESEFHGVDIDAIKDLHKPPFDAAVEASTLHPDDVTVRLPGLDQIEWHDCGGKNATVSFENIKVSPFPIVMNESLSISSDLIVKADVLEGLRSELIVRRLVKVLRVLPPLSLPILCINGYGSCKRDLCEMFRQSAMVCTFMSEAKLPCDCPLKPGNYHLRDLKYKLPVGDGLMRLFASVSVNGLNCDYHLLTDVC